MEGDTCSVCLHNFAMFCGCRGGQAANAQYPTMLCAWCSKAAKCPVCATLTLKLLHVCRQTETDAQTDAKMQEKRMRDS